MIHLSRSQLALAAVLTAAAVALPATAGYAATPSAPLCPQADAFVGSDINFSLALPESAGDSHDPVDVSAGSLPPGVFLSGNLAVGIPFGYGGTPTAAGNYSFSVRHTPTTGAPVTATCTMLVTPGPARTRVSGTDRFDQAAKISSTFASAKTVYIASGLKFSDALSASSIAGNHDSPLLLTTAETATASTVAELQRLTPADVVVVGGPASVSDAVIAELQAAVPGATVTRIGGADRFAVSRALVSHPEFGVKTSSSITLASGANFSDALAASPAAISTGSPVMLVPGDATSYSSQEKSVMDSLGVTSVVIVGGPASVSVAFEASLRAAYTTTRLAGADRFEGSAIINRAAFPTASTVYLASGVTFPDALSAGPVAGREKSPLLLVRQDCIPSAVFTEILRLHPTKIVVLGGLSTLEGGIEAFRRC